MPSKKKPIYVFEKDGKQIESSVRLARAKRMKQRMEAKGWKVKQQEKQNA